MKSIVNICAAGFLGAWLWLQASAQTVSLGGLPLWFEAGQDSSGVSARFTAHGRDSEIVILPDAVQFAFRRSGGAPASAMMRFPGANLAAQISGAAEMTGKVNYLIGSDEGQWRTGVPMYGQVQVEDLYPGVNVVYYGSQQRLEYDFNLAAGVKPETVALQFSGAERISINADGELEVQLAGGRVVERRPAAYQISGGTRHEVRAGYKMLDAHTVVFSVGDYDHQLPLVIDPVLSFSTYFFANDTVATWAIAENTNDGSIYLAGGTLATAVSNTVPFSTPGAYQTNYQGGVAGGDAFVAKFDSHGTNLLYCTYLGGSADEQAYAVTLDSRGDAIVAGLTDSTNFPTTNAVVYGTFNGGKFPAPYDSYLRQYPFEAFISELNSNGTRLNYSTFLGGNEADVVYGIASDPAGDAFVTGVTYSTNFPVTPGAWQKTPAFFNSLYYNGNAFISEIASNGNTLMYSTYLGGTNLDSGTAIAYNNGYVAVAGLSGSTNFPTTNAIHQPYLQTPYLQTNLVGANHVVVTNFYNGSLLNGATNGLFLSLYDPFVAEFAVTSTNLLLRYCTLFGGTNADQATGVAVDAAGNAYVCGWTSSIDFPNTTNANTVYLGSFVSTNYYNVLVTNAFLAKVTYGTNAWNGTNAAAYATFSQTFGGPGVDLAAGVTLDAADNVFVIGSTDTTNIPTTGTNLLGSLATTNAGYSDVFVTVFKSDFSSLLYSAYLGGEYNDYGYGIAVDTADNVYITGSTLSTYFPIVNARQPVFNRLYCGFLAKILFTNTIPALNLQPSGANMLVSWAPVPYEQTTPTWLGLVANTNLFSTNWMPVTQTPVLTNGSYVYTLSRTNKTEFFRFQQF